MQRLRSRTAAAVLAIALAVAVTACGSDDAAVSADTTIGAEAATAVPLAADDEPTSDEDRDDDSEMADDDGGHDDEMTDDATHQHGGYEPSSWPLTHHGVDLPTTFVDASGAEVTISSADRIGSMSGAVSEMLWTLGYGDRIVLIEGTTRYPAELAELPNVGFFRALPAEGILSEMPDVLFVPLDAGPPEALEAVAAAGVVVVRVPPDTPDAAALQTKADLIGAAMGDPEHASVLAGDVLSAYDEAVVEVSSDAPLVAYAVARGQNVLLTGLDSPSNTMISAAGFRTVADELNLETAAPLTPEALVAADPMVIVSTRSSVEQAGGEEAFLALPGIAQTTAGRTGALVVWEDDQSIQQWTPRAPLTVAALGEQISARIT